MAKKISIVYVVALFLLIGLLSGCNSSESEATTEEEQTEVNLKVAVFPADEPTFAKAYEQFKKEYPNINIEFESFPQKQYYEKIRMQLSSGIGYDLFAGQIDTMVDTGILAPLDEYIKESGIDVLDSAICMKP
ncbi:extracellular solute-binding protein [Litoribacterium kuwaitense]|uniref:extracellular solute-binding protein n=1 Tax=Litoribacterium kuwaitense TaxID=1398745 RepID=UPI0024842B8F|nr:extracellular solute-binding protein [Litoribacterium kuwaitense]